MTTKDILESVLKSIWDDPDFILGVVVNAKTEDAMLKIIQFIQADQERGEEVTPENIILLSVSLMNKRKGMTQHEL